MDHELKIFGENILYKGADLDFDQEQIDRICHIFDNARIVAPEDLTYLVALIQCLNEACGNEVGYDNVELILSTLEKKYSL